MSQTSCTFKGLVKLHTFISLRQKKSFPNTFYNQKMSKNKKAKKNKIKKPFFLCYHCLMLEQFWYSATHLDGLVSLRASCQSAKLFSKRFESGTTVSINHLTLSGEEGSLMSHKVKLIPLSANQSVANSENSNLKD